MIIKSVNWLKELEDNNWKVPKRTSFMEFYYIGLAMPTSTDLYRLIVKNNWYFDRIPVEQKEQFRRLYKQMTAKEKGEKR